LRGLGWGGKEGKVLEKGEKEEVSCGSEVETWKHVWERCRN